MEEERAGPLEREEEGAVGSRAHTLSLPEGVKRAEEARKRWNPVVLATVTITPTTPKMQGDLKFLVQCRTQTVVVASRVVPVHDAPPWYIWSPTAGQANADEASELAAALSQASVLCRMLNGEGPT